MDTTTTYNPYTAEGMGMDSSAVAGFSLPPTDDSTVDAGKNVFARAADNAAAIRDTAVPAIGKAAEQLKEVARAGADGVRVATSQMRDSGVKAADAVVTYTRDEPVKALLLSVAIGAALMALVRLLSRSRW